MNKGIISLEQKSLLRVNMQFAMVGVMVGLVLNLIYLVFDPGHFTIRQFVFRIVFSLFITLSITNVVAMFQSTKFAESSRFWIAVIAYYVCNLIGMIAGTELAFFFVNLVTDYRPLLRLHPRDYIVNGTIVMVVGTLILLYYFQKAGRTAAIQAKEKDLLRLQQLQSDAELQALQSKINPHFLYNALNSIASLIHDDADKAEEMTIKLSKLFRSSITSGQMNLHSLKEELDILQTYADIEQVRFGDRMKIIVEAPEALLSKDVPRFLIQPLVENAIKHGLKHTSHNALIRVTIREEKGRMIISVFDNGLPFPQHMEMGYGIQSTYDKLRLLYKNDYDLEMINEPKHVMISIPTAA